MEFKDYYRIMDLPRTATPEEIKRAYRKLARRFHPDVSKEPNAEERFKEVQEAYEVLKDAEKRAAYDQLGSGPQPGQQFRRPQDWGQGFEFRGGADGDAAGAEQFSDFFSSLFGRGTPFAQAHGRDMPGQDHHARIAVSLEDAYAGATRTLELQHPELTPDGQVTLRKRSLRVTIPVGVSDGQILRLAGQGSPAGEGGRAGDLYLQIAFEPHRHFAVEGRDITLLLPVAPWEAALGASVPVPTLGGEVELKIPAGARAGQKLRLRGRGLPGAPPGDQFVILQIVAPPATTPRSRELYAALRDELHYDPRTGLRGRHD
jgi:curved DNA-binding protein